MAAPTRPAPMHQPGWKPWASADVVVEAMLPVAARAATARAAILVLIDMKITLPGSGGPLWSASARLDGCSTIPVRMHRVKIWQFGFRRRFQRVGGNAELTAFFRRKLPHIEFIDVVEQFDEPLRAML